MTCRPPPPPLLKKNRLFFVQIVAHCLETTEKSIFRYLVLKKYARSKFLESSEEKKSSQNMHYVLIFETEFDVIRIFGMGIQLCVSLDL